MKIAVSSTGRDLSAPLDPRFGRCTSFMIVNPDDMSFEAYGNENAALGGGAGIQSAQFVVSKGVKAVITGYCGPNAMQVFSASGVPVFIAAEGTVQSVVEKYKNGKLAPAAEANAPPHAGMGGMGKGRGKGLGRGRGMGGGGGRPGSGGRI